MWAAPFLPLRRKLGSFVALVFDRYYSVETAGLLTRRRLRVAGRHTPGHIDFMSVPLRTFYRAMKCVPAVTDSLTFVEFGCGKGRSLLLAAMWPYRRVIGVEHTPELAAIAERNIRAFSGPRLCGDVRVVRADPVKFHVPPDPAVLFFFGTFEDLPTLALVLANARASQRRRLRPLFAVHVTEKHLGIPEHVFSEAGFKRVAGPTVSRFDPGIRQRSLIFAVFEAPGE